ncbi:MAG: tetraacyldisaccharide 4'-kinase [Desulfovibrionaceae bacterium]|nr:tetraacyldisaccharide 4'-kinase [Desulfovibrionaceae bacterium]
MQRRLRPVLSPFGYAFGLIMRLRRYLYETGRLPRWTAPCLTVSVGNIGWGGSGKTPLAGWLLGWAAQRGLQAALLTRGYGARPEKYPYLVGAESLAEEAGDEPLLLARENPGARVLVDPRRRRAGALACRLYNPALLVLDDGFQHLAVERDLDLVLLRPRDLLSQWNQVIPAGTWREGAEALSRAGAFVLKSRKTTFDKLRPVMEKRLGALGRPVFQFSLVPRGIRRVLGREWANDFDGARYLLVSGVADPSQVKRTARRYFGYPPERCMEFRDHHMFTKNDADDILAEARSAGCEAVLCTPKDAVKLGPLAGAGFWTFDLELVFGQSMFTASNFDVWWTRRYEALRLKKMDLLAERGLAPAPGAEEGASDEQEKE